jgi:PKD repeat protein
VNAIPADGIAPLTVDFHVAAALGQAVSSISWDTDGDGSADASGQAVFHHSHTYQNVGLFLARVTVTGAVAFNSQIWCL